MILIFNLQMKGHTREDWDSFPRTKNQVEEKSLIRQFHSKQFVTAYYEDSQDFMNVLYRAWTASDVDQTPANQRPAIYYTRKFMKARWELKNKQNPHCFHGRSSNMVQTQGCYTYCRRIGSRPEIPLHSTELFDAPHIL